MQSMEKAIARVGHIATRRQLLTRGFSGVDIAAAVHRGVIVRVRRGWYADGHATSDQIDAVFIGGRMSHTTAARSFGLWAGVDETLHVTVTRGASRLRELQPDRSRHVTIHWTTAGRQPLGAHETWRVGLAECLWGVAEQSDTETAVACLDTAITMTGMSSTSLSAFIGSTTAVARARLGASREGSDSGLESIVRQRLTRAGLRVRQQVAIAGVGRVDFVIGRRLVVEVDGRAFHAQAESFERDRSRDLRLGAGGFTVIRLTYRHVMFDWPEVERAIVAIATRVG